MIDSLYFDNHTATKPFPEVQEKFFRFSREYWAEPTSLHFLGQQQLYPFQKSVDSFFSELGAQDLDEIFFTSGGEEAVHQILLNTYLQVARESGKTLFLTSQQEEMGKLEILKQLGSVGCSSKQLSCNSKGQITREILEAAITPRTALFSLSWANGLTGVLHPVADLAEVCKERNILFHLDASYVVGKTFFRFQDLGVDFLTLDGSIMHAPKGVSLTFAKSGISVALPDAKKGANIPVISAFAEAVEMLQAKFEHYCMEIVRLRDLFERGLSEECPGVTALFKGADRLPDCSVMAFPGVVAESLLFLLNGKGVYASCGGGKFQSLTSLLMTTGMDFALANSALSFIFSYDMTEEEIYRAIAIIAECFKQLRKSAGEI